MGDDICNTAYTFTAADGSSTEFYDLYFGFHKNAPYYTFLFSPPMGGENRNKKIFRDACAVQFRQGDASLPTALMGGHAVDYNPRAIAPGRRKRPHPSPYHSRPYAVAGSLVLRDAALKA